MGRLSAFRSELPPGPFSGSAPLRRGTGGRLTAAGNAAVTLAVGPGIYAHEPVEDFRTDVLVAGAPLLADSLLAVPAFLFAGRAGTPWGWLPLRAVSASALAAGPVALGWPLLRYRLAI